MQHHTFVVGTSKSKDVSDYYTGVHKRFWRVLEEAGITDRRLQPDEFKLLGKQYGIYLTELLDPDEYRIGSDSEIEPHQLESGCETLLTRIEKHDPNQIVFVGKNAATWFHRYCEEDKELTKKWISSHKQDRERLEYGKLDWDYFDLDYFMLRNTHQQWNPEMWLNFWNQYSVENGELRYDDDGELNFDSESSVSGLDREMHDTDRDTTKQPWKDDGEDWHINKIINPEVVNLFKKTFDTINQLESLTGPHWAKAYVSFKEKGGRRRHIVIGTHSSKIDIDFLYLDNYECTIAEIAESLGVSTDRINTAGHLRGGSTDIRITCGPGDNLDFEGLTDVCEKFVLPS